MFYKERCIGEKKKLKVVDVNAANIIISVKEIGYCLKEYEEL